MRPVTIVRLGAGDGKRLRAIRLRALGDSPQAFGTTRDEAAAQPPESWELHVNQLATFIAVWNGRDIGIVRGASHSCFGDIGYLLSMWVAPEARRRGIASALVDAIVDWARSRGFKQLLLDVAERNSPAMALYSRKGFVPNGTCGTLPPPREHVREIQMVLRL